jgi:hypothetical protein
MLILILCSAAPGKDILIFRPTSGELAVDVLIVTQLLVPILERRESDGTAILMYLVRAWSESSRPPTKLLCYALITVPA